MSGSGVPAAVAKALAAAGVLAVGVGAPGAEWDVSVSGVGYYNYESPHANPIALLPDASLVYAV